MQIIDRIIAQEGFEHVLSVDYRTRRMSSRTTSAASITSRMNLGEIHHYVPNAEIISDLEPPEANGTKQPIEFMVCAESTDELLAPPVERAKLEDVRSTETKSEKRVSMIRRTRQLADDERRHDGDSPSISAISPTSCHHPYPLQYQRQHTILLITHPTSSRHSRSTSCAEVGSTRRGRGRPARAKLDGSDSEAHGTGPIISRDRRGCLLLRSR